MWALHQLHRSSLGWLPHRQCWKDGTTSMPPSTTLPWTPSARELCLSWKSLTFHPQLRNWARPSTPLLAAKLLEKMASHQKSSRLAGRLPSLHHLHKLLLQCWKGGCVPRYAWCIHHHLIQQQEWPQWLQPLLWNLPTQHCWKGLCPHGAQQVVGACWACLPRSTVWIQGWKINNWHDLVTTSAPKEVPQPEVTYVHHIHQPDHGLWLGQQKRPLYSTAQDWMSPSSWGWLHPFMMACKVLCSIMALPQTPSQLQT